MRLLRLIFSLNPMATILLFGFIFLVAIFAFLLPLIFSVLIEQVLPQQAKAQFHLLIGLALLLVGMRFLLNATQDYLFILLRTGIERKISLQYFTSVIFNLPPQKVAQIGTANLASRLMLWLSNFQYFLSEFIYFCGYALVVSALVFGILFVVEPGFALLALVFLMLHWINYRFHYPIVAQLSRTYNHNKHRLTQLLQSTFSARKAINIYQAEPALLNTLNHSLTDLHSELNGREQAAAWQEYIQNGLRGLQFIAFVYLGIYGLTEQRITLGEMLFCLLLISLAYQPVYRLSKVTKLLGEAQTQLQQLLDLIKEPVANLGSEDIFEIKALAQVSRITLNNIALRISEQKAFEQLDYQFCKGKIYVVEGESGIGKSTLLQVIAGVKAPEQGEVRWEGQSNKGKSTTGDDDKQASYPVAQLSQSNKSEKLSWMTQQAGFLEGSLQQNLTTFSESVSLPRVKQALLQARCDFLTPTIGDKAFSDDHLQQVLAIDIPAFAPPYSGGEAQRLSLARVLYQESDIRLLDEPTANLDAQTEQDILSTITATKQNCITIIVSHRVATREVADHVLTLKDGKLLELDLSGRKA